MTPSLVLGKNMPKTNNCLKMFCYRCASCLRLTQELQTFYNFLDINQKSHEQVLLCKNLAAIAYRFLTRCAKILYNINSNITQKQLACRSESKLCAFWKSFRNIAKNRACLYFSGKLFNKSSKLAWIHN